MITKLDNTRFEVNFLDLYKDLIKSFLIDKLNNYSPAEYNQSKNEQFDVLFLTPSNLASTFYKTDFFINTIVIDGVQTRGKQDIEGFEYHDITDTENQIYYTFEEQS